MKIDLKKNKFLIALAAVALVFALLVATGVVQLPKPSAIQSQEQASQAIGEIGSSVEKIESTISEIEGALK